jgi:replicative DNA helicase
MRKPARPSNPMNDGDRLPPHSVEMELGVAGCVMLSPSSCLDELDEMGFQPEWCYDPRLQIVLSIARAMHFRTPRLPVDLLSLQKELQQSGQLEQIGGITFLATLPEQAPSAANLSYYVDAVREFWQMRVALQAAVTITTSVFDLVDGRSPGATVEEIMDAAGREIEKVAELRTHRSEALIREVLKDKVMPKLERHYTRGRAQLSGLVTTGLEYLDKIFCGLGGDNGNYHVFAARPNVGKTSLITGIALHASLDFVWNEEVSADQVDAIRAAGGEVFPAAEGEQWLHKKIGVPVGISSLEMGAESLGQKMLFQRAKADLQRWRTGFATNEDFPPLIRAAGQISKPNNILIDDTPRENIQSIKAKWRRWHRQYGIRFFMLDYMQLIKSANKRFRQDRVQEMEEISAELQALGKELNCPMAILAQLNRDYEKEPNRLPRMSDLKNCGAIEQDADSVTLLYKPPLKKPGSQEDSDEGAFFKDCMAAKFGDNWRKWDGRPERINALVEKNKHGPKGDAKLLFLKSSTLFVDYTVWLKENGFKQPAKGEGSRFKPGDMPSNEELDAG